MLLFLCAAVSFVLDGYLIRFLRENMAALLGAGYWNGLLYWLNLWLAAVCALLSLRRLLAAMADDKARSAAPSLKNEMMAENYRIMEGKLRADAVLRHEFAHQLAALDALYAAADWPRLGAFLEQWKQKSRQTAPRRFADHPVLNMLLQNAAAQAAESGIYFDASVTAPARLPLPETELCSFLMNLLENALEGARRCAPGAARFIRLRIAVRGGYLSLLCENGFDGRTLTDRRGRLRTTKSDAASHGLGLAVMEQIAAQYGGRLEIHYTDEVFTIRTALRLPADAD